MAVSVFHYFSRNAIFKRRVFVKYYKRVIALENSDLKSITNVQVTDLAKFALVVRWFYLTMKNKHLKQPVLPRYRTNFMVF